MKPFLLAALLVAACAPVTSTSPIRLGAEPVAPDTIRLTLDNGTTSPIGYNLCASGLQQRSGSNWEPYHTDDVCTMELRTLNPGADATYEKRLPANLPGGEYRYVTSVESPLGGSQVTLDSNTFSR